ncbi:deoxyribodipyrimidine photo-lyase [Tahibacter aquaticus]|uniref:Deoxyribodipyrimidine photo-lyase n=1 Tax=Tahibacter aquaticus TaxID=520092 RepID=A0A4R6YYL9_9GAMM|nr:deoxyribodipyrimidine photo-lyase [Tahibacter aquaticus]TDR43968.1 deoxyribodipyrimidine photo-lyase [Tahibacter aquaticus]
MNTAIVWFRRDLRLEDNPALAAALRQQAAIVAVYIHAPDEEAPWQPGAASCWWLHHSLQALRLALRERGVELQLRCGDSAEQLAALVRQCGADAVYFNRLYEPAIAARDRRVARELKALGCALHGFNASLFADPWEVETGQGTPYRVFTPYWRNLRARLKPRPGSAAPRRIAAVALDGNAALDDLKLLPAIRWDTGLHEAWLPGEAGAHEALADFCDAAVRDYAAKRDYPAQAATSRLSPYLHFGEISPQQIFWRLEELAQQRGQAFREMAEPFVRELGWREFSHHLMHHFPQTPKKNLNPQFDKFPWRDTDRAQLQAWQQGRSGIPIVDAGMRELWHTGWMHNRVRMVVASFLCKNLRQHWRHGARWFWDTLVDADLANNTQGWQWTAGTGADAAPYFRIFNPVSQGERFDADGSYVRRWVPELARQPFKSIHAPWKQPALLSQSGYPAPLVDLAESREAALAAYQQMKA